MLVDHFSEVATSLVQANQHPSCGRKCIVHSNCLVCTFLPLFSKSVQRQSQIHLTEFTVFSSIPSSSAWKCVHWTLEPSHMQQKQLKNWLKPQSRTFQLKIHYLLSLEALQSRLGILYLAKSNIDLTVIMQGTFSGDRPAPFTPQITKFDSMNVAWNIPTTSSHWGCAVHLGAEWWYFALCAGVSCRWQPEDRFS